MTLTEFRTRFPKYNNISDDQLYAAVNKTHPGLLDSIPSSFAGGYEESDTGLLVPTPEPSPLPPRKPDRMQEFLAPIKRIPSSIKETRGEAINALFDGFGEARQYDPEEAVVSGVNKMLAAGMLIPGVSEAFGASNALVGEPAANIMQQTGASEAVSRGLGKLGVKRSPEHISSAVQNALTMVGGMAAMTPLHSAPRMVKKAPGLVAGQEAAGVSRNLNAPASMTMTQRANLMLPELARNERGSIGSPYPPPFYSQLSKTITDKKISGHGPSVAGQIEGMAKKGEFKMEELEWTGLLDELRKDPKKKWTNDELKKFIDDHNVDIVEITKSDKLLSYDEALDAIEAKKNVWHSEDRGYHEPLSLDDMYKYGPDDEFVIGGEGTKYGDYALPGGENYRELLLTMPNKNDYAIHKHPVGYGFMLSDGEGNIIKGADGKTKWFQTEAEARSYSPDKPTFKSSHYEEPNILAHIRFNDRTDVDGKRVLFLEEVQSDWHQAGRQEGYATARTWAALVRQLPSGKWTIGDTPIHLSTKEDALAMAESPEFITRYGKYPAREILPGVPDAPFKKSWPMLAFKRMVRYAAENGYDRIAWTTGEQQAARYDLSKQISKVEYEPTSEKMGDLIGYDHSGRKVLYQEDVSYDKLADYIGKDAAGKLIEKADEYRSIGASEELGWSIEKDPDTGKYHIIDPNGDYLYSYGGDLAEFATDAEARADLRWLHDTERSRTPIPSVSGLDLKVGGEGMSGFYDKILPSEINSFFGKEKWGKAKVGQTKISTQDTSRLPSNDEIGNILKSKDSSLYSDLCEYLEVAEGIDRNKATVGDVGSLYREILRELPDKKFGSELTDKVLKHWENDLFGSDTPVHSLDITPQMRQKALTEGMPLFKRADPFDAFEKQLEQKYQPIMELDQPKTNYPLYDRIDSGEVVPGEIERFLAGFKGKSRDLRAKEIRSVIADRVGDMVSTYRYESFEEGRILEDFIDGLLSETGWIPKDGVPSKSGASFKTSSKQPSARVSKAAGVAPEAAQAALEAISRDWLNAPDIQLLPFDQWPTEFKQGAIGTEQGVIIGDKVLIDPARVSSASELHNVIFHESVGHWGLQKVLGDRFEPFLEDISRGLPDSALKDYGFDLSTREGRLQAIREYAADAAMTGKDPGFFSRAAFLLRDLVRRLGFDIKLSEGDVRNILYREIKNSRSYMKGKKEVSPGVMADRTDGSIDSLTPDAAPMFSRQSLPKTKTKLTEYAKKMGKDPSELEKYFKDLDTIARVIVDNQNLDYTPNPLYSSLKGNSDPQYKASLDFSTNCRKRLVLQSTIEDVQKRLNRWLTQEEYMETREALQKAGEEVSCGPCYVDTRRMQIGGTMEGIIAKHPEIPKELFLTQEGFDTLAKDHPSVYAEITDAFGSKHKAKMMESRTDYRGEILRRYSGKVGQRMVSEFNQRSGLRLQSWSDLELPHTLDIMQAVGDMNAVGLMAHTYTKVPEFPELFGNTGIMINLSLIPKGRGITTAGKLLVDDVEGMPFARALKLRNEFEDTTGTVMIGISDDHIQACLESSDIDYIIPFHSSGMSASMRERFVGVGWHDYQQKAYKGRYQREVNRKTGQSVEILWNEYGPGMKTPDELVASYKAVCEKHNAIPKFADWIDDPNYFKLLVDRKFLDHSGNYIEQSIVRPEFDVARIRKILKDYGGVSSKANKKVVNEMVRRFK